MSKKSNAKPDFDINKSISEQIEDIKLQLLKLDNILKKCWQAKLEQSFKLTLKTSKGVLNSEVNQFDAAALMADSIVQYLEKPIETLVYKIQLSETSKSETIANKIMVGFISIAKAIQPSMKKRGRKELLNLQNSVKKLLNCLNTTQDYFTKEQSGVSTSRDLEKNGGEKKKTRITKDEANVRARALIRENPNITAKNLSKKIPCAQGLISSLPVWQALQEYKKKTFGNKKPKIITLTKELEACIGSEDEQLQQLIAEQEGDRREDARQAKLYLSHERKPKRSSK